MSAWVLIEFKKSTCAYKKGDRSIVTLKSALRMRDEGLIKIWRRVNKP